ncbi:MAG: ATPase [Chloroflexi bacterium]|nr:MAG: ATPase [Chloroflexota bacterium]
MKLARPAILAVDGGNSKTDLALVSAGGELRALVHGPTVSHQQVGMQAGVARLEELAVRAARDARLDSSSRPLADLAVLCLAGADFPSDVRSLARAVRPLKLAREVAIRNDGFAGLRTGTNRAWGVAVIAGSGINCVGIAPDGRMASFPAVGDVAGDWGGGEGVGKEGLAAAIRGRDGRGAHTRLEELVPRHFGFRRPINLTYALYRGRIPESRLRELAPLVFEAAGYGDPVARAIVDRLADEVAGMAIAMTRRLRLVRLDVDVVLAGGIMRNRDRPFYERIERAVRNVAHRATIRRVAQRPVLGAALLGLDRLAGEHHDAAETRLRAVFGA